MNAELESQRYIIQIDLPPAASSKTARVNVATLQRALAGTGIQLDPSYAPVCINPQQQRFVVRGLATTAAKQRAEKKLGPVVKFFADGRVQTLANGGKKA